MTSWDWVLHFKAVWQLVLSQCATDHYMPMTTIRLMCCHQLRLLPDFKEEIEVLVLLNVCITALNAVTPADW